ncbi:hypothetical protein WJX84_004729 [Apatococcus fuscideae]|uniref:RBR-type E3 ubiquitin transferase n=1 Tax=Apatococcus fuscideae TaxID=2026836 RepID=A0AAW1T5F2_9CHLO
MSVTRKQDRLRKACQKGDIEVVELLLKQQTHTLYTFLSAVVGTRLMSSCGIAEDWQHPADIEHAYFDDLGNTPLHYIAAGQSRSHSQPFRNPPSPLAAARRTITETLLPQGDPAVSPGGPLRTSSLGQGLTSALPALFGGLARLVSGNVPPTAPQRISSQEEAGSAPLPSSSLPCEPEALLPAIIVLEDLEAIAAHREYNLPSGSEAVPQPINGSRASCLVCFEGLAARRFGVALPCGHPVCDACWKGILMARLDEGDVERASCPLPQCHRPLPVEVAQRLLPAAAYIRFRRLLLQRYVDASPHITWCPSSGCSRAICVLPSGPAAPPRVHNRPAAPHRQFQMRPAANDLQATLAQCADRAPPNGTLDKASEGSQQPEGPHAPVDCQSVAAWDALIEKVKREQKGWTQSWLTQNTKACPGCKARIQRIAGCNHMICTQCHRHFCWVCGGDWNEHGPATGGFYSCNRFAAPGSSGAEGSSAEAAQTEGNGSWWSRMFGGVWNAAEKWRLGFFLRRYHAADSSQHAQLHRAASHLAALLLLSLPPVAPLPSCQHTRRTTDAPLLSDPPLETGITPGLPAVIELASLPAVHPLSSVPSAPGILPGAAAATAPAVKGTTGSRTSALKGAPFHGVSLPGQASANSPGRQAQGSSSGIGSRGSVESFNATGQPADATPGVGQGHDRAALGACLGGLLEDLRDGRELLRNSYILAYFLSWDERRRGLEALQGRLENALELLALPIALLPGDHPAATNTAASAVRQHVQQGCQGDTELLCRQVYYALALAEQLPELRRQQASLRLAQKQLLQAAKAGAFGPRGRAAPDGSALWEQGQLGAVLWVRPFGTTSPDHTWHTRMEAVPCCEGLQSHAAQLAGPLQTYMLPGLTARALASLRRTCKFLQDLIDTAHDQVLWELRAGLPGTIKRLPMPAEAHASSISWSPEWPSLTIVVVMTTSRYLTSTGSHGHESEPASLTSPFHILDADSLLPWAVSVTGEELGMVKYLLCLAEHAIARRDPYNHRLYYDTMEPMFSWNSTITYLLVQSPHWRKSAVMSPDGLLQFLESVVANTNHRMGWSQCGRYVEVTESCLLVDNDDNDEEDIIDTLGYIWDTQAQRRVFSWQKQLSDLWDNKVAWSTLPRTCFVQACNTFVFLDANDTADQTAPLTVRPCDGPSEPAPYQQSLTYSFSPNGKLLVTSWRMPPPRGVFSCPAPRLT